MSFRAATVLSKLSSGSPIPISTTLLMTRSPPGIAPSSRLASHSCPMISPTERFRLNPCLPVEQNRQARVQPAWVEMHRVPRLVSGMNTASIALPLPTSSSHLRVPSPAMLSLTMRGGETLAVRASFSRSDFARSLMRAKSDSPKRCIQRLSWRARNGFSPRPATNPASCSPSRSRRLTVILARIDLGDREKVCDLAARGFGPVGAVHGVGVYAVREIGANGALPGLFRIGRAHQLAVPGNGVFALEHLHHDRAGNHEFNQIAEKRALAVHRVEALGFLFRQVQHTRRDDPQAGSLEARGDLSDGVLRHGVWLDDGQGSLYRHAGSPACIRKAGQETRLTFYFIRLLPECSPRRESSLRFAISPRSPLPSCRKAKDGVRLLSVCHQVFARPAA